MFGMSKVERIKRSNPVEAFIEACGVQLKKEGSSYLGKCPFHDDKTPSLRVTPSKGLWKCFGCGKGGDVITFYEYLKGIDNKQAIAELSRNHGPETIKELKASPSCQSESVEKPTSKTTLKDITRLYHSSLIALDPPQNYLKGRGLMSVESWKKYSVGYCDGSRLKKIIADDQKLQVELKSLGILNEAGNESFYKCVTFPLTNHRGEIVGIYGRSIEGDRHHYTKGKRTGLFNSGACKNGENVILVESIIDALSLIELGIMNVLPLYGVQGYTEEIDRFLMNLDLEEVVLMLDNDETGMKKMFELSELLISKGLQVSRVEIPEGLKDVNELLQAGIRDEEIETMIEKRESLSQKEEKLSSLIAEESENPLIERTKDQLVFKFEELTYRVRGHREMQNSMPKVVVCVTRENQKHIGRLDIYSDKNRRSFASSVAEKCDLQRSKVEDDLLNIIMELESAGEESQLKEEEKAPSMKPADKEKALQLLKNKKLMKQVLADIENLGYVGQDKEKLLLYLSATARITESPIHISIRSTSSSGKSAMMESVISLFPPEKVDFFSRISGQSLYYMDSLKNKVLIVDERSGAEEAEFALRSLMSRGRLDLAVVQKDEKGQCKTKVVEIEGPTTVWDSTTHAVTEDNRNRVFECSMDESEEQTQRIQDREKGRFLSSSWVIDQKVEEIKRTHQNAQRLLKPLKVEIPFSGLLEFPDSNIRSRRDIKRFLCLIASIALLHQYQREIKRTPQGVEYIEASEKDYDWAYRISHDILEDSYSLLQKDSRTLLDQIQEAVAIQAKEVGVDPGDFHFSRRDIRVWTRWSETKVRQSIGELVRMELLGISGGRGRGGFRYKVISSATSLTSKINLLHPDELRRRLQLKEKNAG